MEIVRDRKIKIAVLVFSLVFLMGTCAFAQLDRQSYYSKTYKRNIVTRYNSYALEFQSPLDKSESILLSVKSDSLTNEEITFSIFVYFPLNINPKNASVVIGYEDGTTDVFHQTRFDANDNYTEYTSVGSINNICKKKVAYVVFRGIAKCVNKDKTYFSEFFKYI